MYRSVLGELLLIYSMLLVRNRPGDTARVAARRIWSRDRWYEAAVCSEFGDGSGRNGRPACRVMHRCWPSTLDQMTTHLEPDCHGVVMCFPLALSRCRVTNEEEIHMHRLISVLLESVDGNAQLWNQDGGGRWNWVCLAVQNKFSFNSCKIQRRANSF